MSPAIPQRWNVTAEVTPRVLECSGRKPHVSCRAGTLGSCSYWRPYPIYPKDFW